MRKHYDATRISFDTAPISVQLWIWRSAQTYANGLLLRLILSILRCLFGHKSRIR